MLRILHGSYTILAAITAEQHLVKLDKRHVSSPQLCKHAEIVMLFIVKLCNLGGAAEFMWTPPLFMSRLKYVCNKSFPKLL